MPPVVVCKGEMTIAILVLAGVLALFAILFVGPKIVLAMIRGPLQERIAKDLQPADVICEELSRITFAFSPKVWRSCAAMAG